MTILMGAAAFKLFNLAAKLAEARAAMVAKKRASAAKHCSATGAPNIPKCHSARISPDRANLVAH